MSFLDGMNGMDKQRIGIDMITVLSAVLDNVLYSITFSKLKYQFRVGHEVLAEDANYLAIRSLWGDATKF